MLLTTWARREHRDLKPLSVVSDTHARLSPGPKCLSSESLRVLRKGGKLGLTTWSRLGWLPFVQPTLPDFTMEGAFGEMWTNWSTTENVATQLSAAGFVNVDARYHEFKTTMTGIDISLQLCTFVLREKMTDEVRATMKERLLRDYPTEELTPMRFTAVIVTADKA